MQRGVDKLRQQLEKMLEQSRFKTDKLRNLIPSVESLYPELRDIRGLLGSRDSYTYILVGILRRIFLIEPVKRDISSTKMWVRWKISEDLLFDENDPRFCPFEMCVEAFKYIINALRELLEENREDIIEQLGLFRKYYLFKYEIPLDYAKRPQVIALGYRIHEPENFKWFFSQKVKNVLILRKELITDSKYGGLFKSILRKKIKVKVYLTDRALTGEFKTNREKRWEAHPASPQFALARTCLDVEYELLIQLCHFEEFPRDVYNKLLKKGIIQQRAVTRCPVTLEPLSFSALKDEVERPEHGRARIQIGHKIPLKRGGLHKPENIAWISEDGNRIQGDLTLEEARHLILKIAENYKRFGLSP